MGVLVVMIMYVIFKVYVLETPSKLDDDIPEQIRDALLLIVNK